MSEVILLDTHIWLWYVNGNFDRIPEHWLDQIEGADQVDISYWIDFKNRENINE
jgi:PIN domain nuclease of toxin-antitoxin system